ncbi:hypothetical protein NC652_023469 [Populus alba x Populus x berolinensis]|nr:hypothetical protein NC652_023469 [Populus alba x Populus x berolinensis]
MVWGSRMGLPLPSFGFGVFSQLSQCLGPAGSREAVAALSLAFHLGAGNIWVCWGCLATLLISYFSRVLTYAFVCGLLAALGVMD